MRSEQHEEAPPNELPKLRLRERRALRVDVRDELTKAIMQGRFRPGERIVESHVAREIGVSQTTVREALRELESTGLVVYQINQGCVVRKLSPTDIVEMYEMRGLLDGEAARRAATRISPADLAHLDRLVAEMIELADAGQTSAMLELDIRFHRAIFEIAGHTLLTRLWTTMNPALWTHLSVVGILSVPPDVIARRHSVLVDALRSGDPAIAQAAMVAHLLELRDVAERQLNGMPLPDQGTPE